MQRCARVLRRRGGRGILEGNFEGKLMSWSVYSNRKSLILAAASSVAIAIASPSIAAGEAETFDIAEQTLSKALLEFSEQTDIVVVAPRNLVTGKSATPVKGDMAPSEALSKILDGTGLNYTQGADGGFTIVQTAALNEGERRERGFLRLAQAQVQQSEETALSRTATTSERDTIIVTATRREERVQDIPAAITAIGADEISKRNLVGMDDFLRSVPGVSFQDRGAGQNSIVIRGLSTNPQVDDTTTAVYFGEAIVSGVSSASQSGNIGSVDFKLVDIERIEVLRGPQGTLYGAGSMAGTVRIIPKAPVLDRYEGSFSTRFSVTEDEGSENYSLQGAFNAPIIEDTLAIRVAAYHFDNSGFIRNTAGSAPDARIANAVDNFGAIAVDRGDRGNEEVWGVRASALWEPTDNLDFTFNYVRQEHEQDGWPEVDLGSGSYRQQRLLTGENQSGDEFITTETSLYNLVANYDLGWGQLTSATTQLENQGAVGTDLVFGFLGGDPWSNANDSEVDVFSQELRIASDLDGPLQFVLGGYYEDRDVALQTLWTWSGDPALSPLTPDQLPFSRFDRLRSTEQIAAFGEVSYEIFDRLEATAGGRYFDYEVNEVSSLIGSGALLFERDLDSNESGEIYKAALNYSLNEDVNFYAQWAQGFRIGRATRQTPQCTAIGVTVEDIDSDRSTNYEIGAKSVLANGAVVFNAALFRTDWDDIPVNITTDSCNRTVNAGKAKTQGIEIELLTRITENLQFELSGSYIDATLEETSSIGQAGDNLPGSADYNLSSAIQYDFQVGGLESFARLDYAYVGEYYNNVAETGVPAGDFSQLHFKIGTTVDRFSADFFVNNLTNSDGLTWVETNLSSFTTGLVRAYQIRPRTVGINLGYQF